MSDGTLKGELIVCECGFKTLIHEPIFEECAIGVCGNVSCPECKTSIMDKIKKRYSDKQGEGK